MSRTWRRLLRWLATVGTAAATGGVAGAIGTAIINDFADSRAKLRTATYEQESKVRDGQKEAIKKFLADDDDAVVAASRAYASSVLEKKPLLKPAEHLGDEVAKKIRQAEGLRAIFPNTAVGADISAYQQALQSFSDSTEGFTSPLKMKDWSESFSKIQVAKQSLRETLRKIADQPPKAL